MSDNEENPRQKPSRERERERERDGENAELALEASPGEAYVIFIEMNNLSNKLKLLNYEDEYLIKWKMKSIPRHYFAIASNAGEQFHNFISLAAWLIQQAGSHFDRPQEVTLEIFHFKI